MAVRKIAIEIKVTGAQRGKKQFRDIATAERAAASAGKKLDSQFKAINQTLKRLEPQTRKLSMLQQGLTSSFIKGNIAARGISAAYINLRNAITFGIRGAIDYQFSMAKVVAITGTAGRELQVLEKEIRSIAAISPRTAAEVANTALAMAKLGLSGTEVKDALEGVIGLSVALDEGVEDVGRTLVNVKNVFQREASELTQISDQLFTGFANSALNLEKFGTAFSFAGGSAKLAGVKFEELIGVMGVLNNSGIRASTIGTQLRKVFVELSSAHTRAGKAIGGESIKTIGLTAALRKLRDLELDSIEVKRLFGQRSISVVAALLQNIDAVEQLTETVREGDGATKEASDLLRQTMFNALKEVSSAWTELNIVVSEFYSPAVTSGLKIVADIIRGISENLDVISLDPQKFAGNIFLSFLKKVGAEVRKTITDTIAYGTELEALDEKAKLRAMAEEERQLVVQQNASAIKSALQEEKDDFDDLRQKLKDIKLNFNLSKAMFGKKDPSATIADVKRLGFAILGLKRINETLRKEAALAAFSFAAGLTGKGGKKEKPIVSNAKKEFAAYQRELGKTPKLAEKIAESWAKLSDARTQFSLESSLQFQLLNEILGQTVMGINALSRGLGENLVGALFGVKTATIDFGEIFKNVAVQITSQITAMLIKFAIFKGLLAAFGIAGTGGFGFAGGTGLQKLLLGGFGGQAQPFATGFDGVVRQPTLFAAGEAGAERVSITPRARMNVNTSSDGGITVVINGDVFGEERFMEAVNRANQMIDRRHTNV